MKYVLLFVETEQFASEMAAMGGPERERAYARVDEWFASNADKLRGGSQAEVTGNRDDGATRPWRTDDHRRAVRRGQRGR